MITVKAFAQVREVVGHDEWQVAGAQKQTVADVLSNLCEQDVRWKAAMDDQLLVAVNHTMRDSEFIVHDGDEVAFFPPVTGG